MTSILSDGLPTTFQLLAYALFISLALTVPIALLAARNPGGFVDRIGMVTSMAGLSVARNTLRKKIRDLDIQVFRGSS